MEHNVPTFWIGHHEDKVQSRISQGLIQKAHLSGYDMITCPVTTALFHSRVLALLSSTQPRASYSNGDIEHLSADEPARLTVPPLSPVDTVLMPNEAMSQVIATTSPWIDLCSRDPLVADVSKQVLMLEIAYAAFCGINYVLIQGPRLHHTGAQQTGLMQYARAIQEVLSVGSYMQVKLWFPMIAHPENEAPQMGDLAPFARPEYVGENEPGECDGLDLYGTWDAWNIIRSFCKYHTRLCVALILPRHLPPVSIQTRWHSESIKLLTIDATIFTKNVKGYTVLSKPHQTLISRYMRLRIPPWMLLCNVGPIPGVLESFAGADPTIGPTKGLSLPLSPSSFPTPAEAAQSPSRRNDDLTPHLSYMRNLQNKQPPQTQLERFGSSYQDYLQAPLQPLAVNLESITYEVFEKDPIKYDWYEKAIAQALHDWIEQGKPTSSPDGRVVVAVVGAGRGPLVTRALRASDDVGVEIDMWALEKNPNAFVLLQDHNADPELWASRVTLVKSDMRTWRGPARQKTDPLAGPIGQAISPEPPRSSFISADKTGHDDASRPVEYEQYKIDILISELLGSFADNELSPECLDGVQHLLNPIHGISIPASYGAYLTPIAAPKLHADISTQEISNPNAAQTPYVVMLHAIDYLSMNTPTTPNQIAPTSHTSFQIPNIRKAWSFSHPNHHLTSPPSSFSSFSHHSTSTTTNQTSSIIPITSVTNTHNTRHAALTFPIPYRGTCHGLAGYFEAVLYNRVELSTNPLTMDQKSEGMISWFPIYFPLKTPIYCPDDSAMMVNMWRQTDDRKVWYEWIVEVWATAPDAGHDASAGSGEERVEGGTSTRAKTKAKTKKTKIIAMSELHSSVKEACLM